MKFNKYRLNCQERIYPIFLRPISSVLAVEAADLVIDRIGRLYDGDTYSQLEGPIGPCFTGFWAEALETNEEPYEAVVYLFVDLAKRNTTDAQFAHELDTLARFVSRTYAESRQEIPSWFSYHRECVKSPGWGQTSWETKNRSPEPDCGLGLCFSGFPARPHFWVSTAGNPYPRLAGLRDRTRSTLETAYEITRSLQNESEENQEFQTTATRGV